MEARKKGKGKETEVVRVKRTEKRGEETELEELIEQQRLMGLGVEKMLRVIEGKDWKREEEREREWEEKRKAEEEVENKEKTDSEEEMEETAAGEKDADGDADEVEPAAST